MTAEIPETQKTLKREVGVFGAVMLGLGSIIGTGVFVSIGIAAGVTGPSVILAIAVAGCVATCNALSSAQLAAAYPVSGGTYEYGYRLLHPTLGYTAGWMFLCAKSASAATAALGFSVYALQIMAPQPREFIVPIAVAAVVVSTMLVRNGIRRSSTVNTVIVTVTLLSLAYLVMLGMPVAIQRAPDRLTPFFNPMTGSSGPVIGFLEACALMIVAYTGYGRIATLGEEIHDPQRNIPKAIVATLLVSMLVYGSVGFVAICLVDEGNLSSSTFAGTAPLVSVAHAAGERTGVSIIMIGAMTAMAGVLLNLILGLSRVVLAMGRRGDVPSFLGRIDASGTTPTTAVVFVGLAISGLVLIGDVRTTWSFSAFTVLIYYALTNLSALKLSAEQRLYPRWISWTGLGACLSLAFFVETRFWLIGLALIVVGLVSQQVMRLLPGHPERMK